MRVAFDDGPHATTLANLDTLAKYGVKATFFLVGELLLDDHTEALERIVAEGHEVGNHSWSHARLTDLNFEEVGLEIGKADVLIEATTGVFPTAFRPPFTACNELVREVAAMLGHTCHERTSTGDYAKPADDIIELAGEWHRAGEATLWLHDKVEATVFALPTILANGWCS